ncbi:MAG TPA: PHB depolymerase family esterase [Rugosimonospora sp.]|nr:PHB depolymerase family esterase [Rugosimonospora sp.]
MRTSRLALVCLLGLALTGCTGPRAGRGTTPTAPAAPAAVGASTQIIDVDGRQRSFILYRPAGLPAAPVPLVVMLHGGFGSGSQAEGAYGWDAQADAGHFLVAYPDGVQRAWAVGGGCCGTPGRTGVDDVAFISRMVAAIGARVPVDPARVYATGISNGGMMAYRLACDTSLFAAIGPDSATLLGTCPHPAPVSVIHIHGTADQNIPYNGGQGSGVARIDGPPVPSVVAMWREVDQCPAPSTTTAAPVTTATAGCPHGRSVELITIAGAGHQWPGGVSKPELERLLKLDPPSTALNATATIWQFFAAHPKPA